MQWDVEPTGARIAQLASDLTARIEALDPESDTPVYADFSFAIAVADWTLANGVYTARVNNTVLLTENAGIQVFYDASLRNYLVGDIFADKHTGYIDFTTTHLPVGSISGIVRVLDSVSGNLSVARGGTGASTPKQARENLNTPIRDIPINFGTVSSLPQTIYDADITANMVAFDAVFGNPAAVPGGIDVTFAAGSVTISGTMVSGQDTTIKFWAHEERSAVEGTETGTAEPRVNDFVQVGAQTLTATQQAQIRTNLGAASAEDVTSLNGKIETYQLTSSADTLENIQSALVTFGATLGNNEIHNIRFNISTATGVFNAEGYVGTIKRYGTGARYIVEVQNCASTGNGEIITGRYYNNVWKWDSLNKKLGDLAIKDVGNVSNTSKAITFSETAYFVLISYGGSDTRMGMWIIRGTSSSVNCAEVCGATFVNLSASGGTLTITTTAVNVYFKAFMLVGSPDDIVVGN